MHSVEALARHPHDEREHLLADAYTATRRQAEGMADGTTGFYQRREALRLIEAECGENSVFPIIALRERGAFVSFYTDYHFSQQHGGEPGAMDYIDPALLHLLNRLHEAVGNGDILPESARRALFTTACSVYGRYGDEMTAAAC